MNRAATRVAVTVAALLALGGQAVASPDRGLQLDATWGFRAGGEGLVSEGRVFAGYSHHFRLGDRRSTFLALGVSAGGGTVHFDDPRGLDGKLTASRMSIAPTTRVGFAWSKARWPAAYAYLSAAPVRVVTDTDSEMLVEAGTAYGARFSLGFAFPGSYRAIIESMDDDDSGSSGGGDALVILLMLAPNTVEVTYEELYVDGEAIRRGGLGLGYSF